MEKEPVKLTRKEKAVFKGHGGTCSVWIGNEVSDRTDPKTWGWRPVEASVTEERGVELKGIYEQEGYSVSFERPYEPII